MIRAVVFDLWETLGTKNVPVSAMLQQHLGLPRTDDYLRRYEEAVQLEIWKTEEEMAQNFLRAFGKEQNPDDVAFVVDVFQQGIARATMFDGMHEILTSLKQKGLKIGLLSNTTIFESAVPGRWGIADVFDAAVFSWQTADLKPSRAAFEAVARQLDMLPEEILFIDDGNKNVVAARTIGMQAVIFEGAESLRRSLAEQGIAL